MQHPLPAGCHDASSAAQLLGISKIALLQMLREYGWLHVGGTQHNMPHRTYIQRGWLATHERGYALKGKKEITKTYKVMLLTQKGFQELKKTMADYTQQTTEIQPKKTTENKEKTQESITQENREALENEREKALKQLRSWGIA